MFPVELVLFVFLISTALTIVVVPAAYVAVTATAESLRGLRRGATQPALPRSTHP